MSLSYSNYEQSIYDKVSDNVPDVIKQTTKQLTSEYISKSIFNILIINDIIWSIISPIWLLLLLYQTNHSHYNTDTTWYIMQLILQLSSWTKKETKTIHKKTITKNNIISMSNHNNKEENFVTEEIIQPIKYSNLMYFMKIILFVSGLYNWTTNPNCLITTCDIKHYYFYTYGISETLSVLLWLSL